MEEIAQFREELTEIISRYQSKIPARQFISTVSSVLCKQLDIKRASIKWEREKSPVFMGLDYAPGFPIIDEFDTKLKKVIQGTDYNKPSSEGEHKCTD